MDFKFIALIEVGNQKELYENIVKDFDFGSLGTLNPILESSEIFDIVLIN
jgi:hypothetical protein